MLPTLDQGDLDFNDAPQIIWIRVQDAVTLLWPDNPKLHDMGSVIESILLHGFQELPKYDATLNAIKAGNGRIESLAAMEHSKEVRAKLARQELSCPRGLGVERTTGAWVMPLLIGTDAPSLALAESYAIDSNNLTMMGGDFTALDMMRLWDPTKYRSLLTGLAGDDLMPVSVDNQDLQAIISYLDKQDYNASDARGMLLEKFKNYGISEPPQVERDEVYLIDRRHILAVVDFISHWASFIPYLREDVKFIPLPGPYIFVTEIAKSHNLVLVQPDPYMAGLLLQSAELVYGKPAKKI